MKDQAYIEQWSSRSLIKVQEYDTLVTFKAKPGVECYTIVVKHESKHTFKDSLETYKDLAIIGLLLALAIPLMFAFYWATMNLIKSLKQDYREHKK